MEKQGIINEIKKLVKEYYIATKQELPANKVPVSGKVFDDNELINLTESALDMWWTEGRWSKLLCAKLKEFLPSQYVLLVNSGSSANFLAIKSLTSVKLGDKRIKPGDEVITVAAGFPTTINPIIDIQAIPVFVDIDIGKYNAKIEDIEKAITPKTKAIILAHTLGNPFNIEKIKKICEENNLWLIEDNCDALGSKYGERHTGTFGDISTLSFYPAHHITTGEGGAVFTNNALLYKIARSMRNWGRDCWCETGQDNACGKRFSWQLGMLPYGYDHKYIHSELGYNLKITDMQSAIGVAQMDKLQEFTKARINNFNYLYEKLKEFSDHFILPEAEENTQPSWFGFPLTVRGNIKREAFMAYLNDNGVKTRVLFGGNITKQPYFIDNTIQYRSIGDLPNTDIVMNSTFWVGIYPALKKEHLDHIYEVFKKFISEKIT